jgi:Peptidase C13 family
MMPELGGIGSMQFLRKTMIGGSALLCATSVFAQVSEENVAAANRGFATTQGRSAAWHLAEHRRLAASIAALKPQRPGIVDAYVMVAGLDDDDVFGREAAEAARVLSRRYDAVGRTVLISAGTGARDTSAPNGTPGNLATMLAAVASRMNVKEDVLILYTTSHGAPRIGIASKDGKNGYGMIAPLRLAELINELGIERRMVMISACYSGQFVTPLATPSSAIITAADDNRTSFGCAPSNDWTFFGDALINTALRKPQATEAAVSEAFTLIGGWEFTKGLTSSLPRSFIGDQAKLWLAALEKRMPTAATAKVGRPAIEEVVAAKPQ